MINYNGVNDAHTSPVNSKPEYCNREENLVLTIAVIVRRSDFFAKAQKKAIISFDICVCFFSPPSVCPNGTNRFQLDEFSPNLKLKNFSQPCIEKLIKI